ncbi:MAG TPA: nuclear transport factor 2 family protein [Actinomycetota bacterium]|nr:nuclear transport factor 2 family protein [Actinomycetota bacterium]
MSIRTAEVSVPSEAIDKELRAFQDAVNAGDLEALVGSYEPGAIFVVEPEKPANGVEEIRQTWAGILTMQPTFELNGTGLYHSGDLALGTRKWTLDGKDAEGNPVHLEGHCVATYRRQQDGRWLLVLDNACPFD